jgi:UDP-N-acetylmuramoylalanine-D-glutamate ligase
MFARSGLAMARFLSDQGAEVTVYDALPADALRDAVASLGEPRPRLLLGPDIDPRLALRGQALICTSPSVSSRYPTTEPRLRAVLAEVESAGVVPIVSESDLFLRLCRAHTVGVTGTKRKTTTSSLRPRRWLVLARPPATSAGCHRVRRGADGGASCRPRASEPSCRPPWTEAAHTHVTSDHLDRHGDVASYCRRTACRAVAGGRRPRLQRRRPS